MQEKIHDLIERSKFAEKGWLEQELLKLFLNPPETREEKIKRIFDEFYEKLFTEMKMNQE